MLCFFCKIDFEYKTVALISLTVFLSFLRNTLPKICKLTMNTKQKHFYFYILG